jgi:Ion transport protein
MMDETAEDIDQQRSDVPRGGPSSPHNPLLHSSSRKSRRTGNMLPFFPAPANVRSFNRIPGMQQTASNLSESTGGHTVDAFMAYEKYAEKTGIGTGDSDNDTVEQDSHSVQSRFSFSSSLHSRDTFSTSPAVGTKKATGGRFLPTPITRACCWHSKWAESIVKSRIFKRLSIFFILLNCTLCAVATSDWVTESFRRNRQFDTMKEIFVWITTTELVFQVLAHGPYLLTDGWLVFDLIVVGFSLTFHNFLVIRTFRVVRTLR